MTTKDLLTLISKHLFTAESQPDEIVCSTETNPEAVRDCLEGKLKINDVPANVTVEEADGMTCIILSCNSPFAKNAFQFSLLNEDLTEERLVKMMNKKVSHAY